jgi:chromosome segregation ATPase
MEQPPSWAVALIEQVQAMRAEMATRADLVALRADLEALRADLEALRGEMVTRADLGILATHEELDQLNASLMRIRTEIMERIDRLQEALTRQQQESVVNYATASRARETMRSLEEEVTALTRMVMRLSRRLDDLEGRQKDH